MTRPRTPQWCGVCSPASADRTATSWCSTPAPGWSSVARAADLAEGARRSPRDDRLGCRGGDARPVRRRVPRGRGLTRGVEIDDRRWSATPASSANLGAGFDVLGMALGLHAEVGVGDPPRRCARGRRSPSGRRRLPTAGRHRPAVGAIADPDGARARLQRRGEWVERQRRWCSGAGSKPSMMPATVPRSSRSRPSSRARRQRRRLDLRRGRGGRRRRGLRVPLGFDPTVVVWVPESTTTSTEHSRSALPDEVSLRRRRVQHRPGGDVRGRPGNGRHRCVARRHRAIACTRSMRLADVADVGGRRSTPASSTEPGRMADRAAGRRSPRCARPRRGGRSAAALPDERPHRSCCASITTARGRTLGAGPSSIDVDVGRGPTRRRDVDRERPRRRCTATTSSRPARLSK